MQRCIVSGRCESWEINVLRTYIWIRNALDLETRGEYAFVELPFSVSDIYGHLKYGLVDHLLNCPEYRTCVPCILGGTAGPHVIPACVGSVKAPLRFYIKPGGTRVKSFHLNVYVVLLVASCPERIVSLVSDRLPQQPTTVQTPVPVRNPVTGALSLEGTFIRESESKFSLFFFSPTPLQYVTFEGLYDAGTGAPLPYGLLSISRCATGPTHKLSVYNPGLTRGPGGRSFQARVVFSTSPPPADVLFLKQPSALYTSGGARLVPIYLSESRRLAPGETSKFKVNVIFSQAKDAGRSYGFLILQPSVHAPFSVECRLWQNLSPLVLHLRNATDGPIEIPAGTLVAAAILVSYVSTPSKSYLPMLVHVNNGNVTQDRFLVDLCCVKGLPPQTGPWPPLDDEEPMLIP